MGEARRTRPPRFPGAPRARGRAVRRAGQAPQRGFDAATEVAASRCLVRLKKSLDAARLATPVATGGAHRRRMRRSIAGTEDGDAGLTAAQRTLRARMAAYTLHATHD